MRSLTEPTGKFPLEQFQQFRNKKMIELWLSFPQP